MPPHILQLVCHDLGRHLGCYGRASVATPALDRLAAEGTRFSNSFCTSPGCSPSRAALATGRYPHANGCMGLAHGDFGWELAPGEQHVASLLREAGYYTVLFGLQHVTYQVEQLGFAEVRPEGTADQVAANLAGFLQQQSASTPLYLEVNFFEPHRPYDFGGVEPDEERGVVLPPYLPENEAARGEEAALQGAIRKADSAVSEILAALESTGLAPDTLVLFTSDHGLAMPRAKGTLLDAGIEVALILRWPGVISAATVRDELVSNVDVLPTYLEAAGAPVPDNIQGRSFLSLMRGDAPAARDAVFAEKTYHEHYDPQRCIRTRRHKLIQRFESSNRAYLPTDIMASPIYPEMFRELAAERSMLELYDLEEDPLECRNLAAEANCAELREDLGGRLRDWMRDTGDPLLHGPIASPFARRSLEQLEAFGAGLQS
jgi:arylsulfatase A-like enzyme